MSKQECEDRASPAGPELFGHLVLVVGPSGAGKDALIGYARGELGSDARYVFVDRAITRPPGGGEINRFLSQDDFAAAEARGDFALSWRSHGHAYGIPRAVRADLAAGRVVVANVSRTVLTAAAGVAAQRIVIEISAAPLVLAGRLAARGREAPEDVASRLAREVPLETSGARHVVIDNSGALAVAGQSLVAVLTDAAGVTPSQDAR